MVNKTFTLILIETRPNLSLPFYSLTSNEVSFLNSLVTDTHNLISQEMSLSEDQLTRTTSLTFASFEDRKIVFQDPRYTELVKNRSEYNKIHMIEARTQSYEGNDSSLALDNIKLVARFSSNDAIGIDIDNLTSWTETLGIMGLRFDPATGSRTEDSSFLLVDNFIPSSTQFTYDNNDKSIILDGTYYFKTEYVYASTFAEINQISKSFFIAVIPDIDSLNSKRCLMHKFDRQSNKGWVLNSNVDGSIELIIRTDNNSKTYITQQNVIIPGMLNTIGFSANLSNVQDSIRIFVNGQPSVSSYHGIDTLSDNNLLYIGSNGVDSFFKGKLLGFRVYYRSLLNSEFDVLHRLFLQQLES